MYAGGARDYEEGLILRTGRFCKVGLGLITGVKDYSPLGIEEVVLGLYE